MRKTEKAQAEEFVKILEQAHEEIKKDIDQGRPDAARDLLEQCQEGAIRLGELIETREGEQCATIPLLEAYCEVVYQIHEDLGISASVDPYNAYKKLKNSLIHISSSIGKDIKVRLEAVFLPYKASMWDSLESVWKAADEDPDCDAYVIPIPYYDRTPDGGLGVRHYEASEYPKYVPVTRYDEYDFAKRRPDMIFIHNPYDNTNLATSVHPFFYSDNLKKFTDKLVYIPYYILNEISPDDVNAVEEMAHFCTTAVMANADKIIVQSEAMRQIYIEVLTKKVGEDSREVWEERILGLGSPKVDKVLNTRREDLEIPEEWLKIIRKPDGSWKKIVFYNIAIFPLIRYNEKMLEKIRWVFSIFRENKEEAALLWRPHPLMKASLASMKPELLQPYEELVEQYKAEGWGIYDDTADMDRAVALCDAYYGDGSSIVQLCQMAGKPVMMQNVNMLEY